MKERKRVDSNCRLTAVAIIGEVELVIDRRGPASHNLFHPIFRWQYAGRDVVIYLIAA